MRGQPSFKQQNTFVIGSLLTGNLANGAYGGSLSNCSLVGNTAFYVGGGACQSTLNYCSLIGNTAEVGGGMEGDGSTVVNNCVFAGNTARESGGGAYDGVLTHCTLVGNSVIAPFWILSVVLSQPCAGAAAVVSWGGYGGLALRTDGTVVAWG